MATQQQAVLLDTLVGLKKAVKRKAYGQPSSDHWVSFLNRLTVFWAAESDSDESVEQNTNRGHKLQKRARFVKRGNLAPAMVPAAYKELVEHVGYQRVIINRNPPLIDDEGYEIDSDDNEERVQEAMAEAADANPYSAIHLERKSFQYPAMMPRYSPSARNLRSSHLRHRSPEPPYPVATVYIESPQQTHCPRPRPDAQGEQGPVEGQAPSHAVTRRSHVGAVRDDDPAE